MKRFKYPKIIFGILIPFLISSCNTDRQWKGQDPIVEVSTSTVPIQKQFKGIFELPNGVSISNNFAGARMNGVTLTNDSLATILITPENAPINESPWYAFKIWAKTKKDFFVKLTYQYGVKNRYYPRLSNDGENWKPLDSINYFEGHVSEENNEWRFPDDITMKLSVSPDTLLVSAQELITSIHNENWMQKLALKSYTSIIPVGKSYEGRTMNALRIGNNDDKKMIIVLSRQHPPEVTGHLAMQAFVETICSDNHTAEEFRTIYNTYVIPLMNPDGVDHGHWRHNAGGVDINRDWNNSNQTEISVFEKFIKEKVQSSKGILYASIDFHSTWQDIFYTIDPKLKGNMPGLIYEMIESMAKEIPGYQPNIQSALMSNGLKISSTSYLFHEYGSESVTYEVGDNTPRELIHRKGNIAALKLMEIMLDKTR